MDYYSIILGKKKSNIININIFIYYLIYSISHKGKLKELAELSYKDGYNNIAFNCYLQINDLEKCVDVLLESNQIPEACLFCRTYLPSRLPKILDLWNEAINTNNIDNRISMKVLNPLENLDNKKLELVENKIQEFYEYCDTADISKLSYLNKFISKDIEKEIEENNDIDLTDLLDN